MLRSRMRACVVATLVALMVLVASPAHAEPAQLTASYDVSGQTVQVNGRLTVGGSAVKRATITATLGGKQVASVQTRGNGGYSLSFSTRDLAPGNHSVVIAFAGNNQADAAQTATTVRVEGQTANPQPTRSTGQIQPPATRPTEPRNQAPANNPSPSAAASTPTATVATSAAPASVRLAASGPGAARNGEFVTITGTLADGAGAGIDGVGISVSDAAGVVEESYTVTEGGGAFETWYTIPEDQATGTVTLTLSFDGAGRFAPATATVAIPVTYQAVATSDPSPTPTETATSADSEPAASPTATASESATPGTTAVTERETSPWTWLLLALVVVGGLAIIATAGLVFRSKYGRRREPDEAASAIDFLDEELTETAPLFGFGEAEAPEAPPSAPVTPEPQADTQVFAQPTDEAHRAARGAEPSAAPSEPVRPARAMPEDD